MGRVIKFRAWCNPDMGTFKRKKFMENKIETINLEPTENDPLGEFIGEKGIWCGIHEAVLMQYTGITDKNEKEIYEGDVVRIDGQKENFVVVWVNDTARFGLQSKTKLLYFEPFLGEKIEVIGNKYEPLFL